MAKSEPKTKPTKASALKYVDSIENDTRKADAKIVLSLLKKVTGKKAVMWGDKIVGFDVYHYESSSCEGDWPMIGFSAGKTKLSFYIMPGFKEYGKILEKLGKHKHSVGCLYVNKLADVDLKILEKLLDRAYKDMKKKYAYSEMRINPATVITIPASSFFVSTSLLIV